MKHIKTFDDVLHVDDDHLTYPIEHGLKGVNELKEGFLGGFVDEALALEVLVRNHEDWFMMNCKMLFDAGEEAPGDGEQHLFRLHVE